MKKSIGFLSAVVLSVTVVGCSDSMSPAAPSSMSLSEGISSNSDEAKGGRAALPTIAVKAASLDDFSTLVAALDKAGLVETFNGSRQYTVFAPTNSAFDALAEAKGFADGAALVEALGAEALTPILLYHVTLGDRNSKSVVASGQVTMLDGNSAAVSTDQFGAYIAGAKILIPDVLASNGIIHAIDAVLLPPSGK